MKRYEQPSMEIIIWNEDVATLNIGQVGNSGESEEYLLDPNNI